MKSVLIAVMCASALPLATLADETDRQTRSRMMDKYVIERDLPGAGKLSQKELQAISQKSREVLRSMAPRIQWVESYVTEDKIYCVYFAESEAEIRKHGAAGGFPVNRVSRVRAVIDPATAAPVIWP